MFLDSNLTGESTHATYLIWFWKEKKDLAGINWIIDAEYDSDVFTACSSRFGDFATAYTNVDIVKSVADQFCATHQLNSCKFQTRRFLKGALPILRDNLSQNSREFCRTCFNDIF